MRGLGDEDALRVALAPSRTRAQDKWKAGAIGAGGEAKTTSRAAEDALFR